MNMHVRRVCGLARQSTLGNAWNAFGSVQQQKQPHGKIGEDYGGLEEVVAVPGALFRGDEGRFANWLSRCMDLPALSVDMRHHVLSPQRAA